MNTNHLKKDTQVSPVRRVLPQFFNQGCLEFWFEKNLPTGTTIPAVNIKENNENFTVEMAAPVMNENDF